MNVTSAYKRCCVSKTRLREGLYGKATVLLHVLWLKQAHLATVLILCCLSASRAVLASLATKMQ